MAHEDLIFSTIVYPGTSVETDVVLLCESIRAYGGALAQAPIWCFIPHYGKALTVRIKDRLHTLGVTLIRFEIEQTALRFPFIADARAAVLAETRAQNRTDILVWLTANTLVLQEPVDFLIPENMHLAYRPVHHTLIGSRYNEPPDPFWTLVYKRCNVSDDRIFAMNTHVDNTTIRPYFNAGILVTRPKNKLLHTWCDTFIDAYQKDEFYELYTQDERYTIFMHQAILSGVILSLYRKEQLLELPRTYNYPLHLYDDDVTPYRPSALEELVTVRHEGFYKDPAWYEKMPAGEPMKKWLRTVLGTGIIA
jgi:hypothetical protein